MASSKFQFSIDRGGTFTDVYWQRGTKQGVLKLLSEDPKNYPDAPREGIRRILESEGGISCPRDKPVPTDDIDSIRMGTTVATNALLERKGARMALLVTKGFRDLLHIGNQARPLIFDLKCARPGNLYETVVEVDERLVLLKDDLEALPGLSGKPVITASTGEQLVIERAPDVEAVRAALTTLQGQGITSVAVAFLHACVYGAHESAVGACARALGFTQVSLSHEVMPMVKIVPRGYTACADGYLTPHIGKYVQGFRKGFAGQLTQTVGQGGTKLLFMQSDGGLAPVEDFSGHRAILSGPAGGVVGFASTTWEACGRQPVVAFDMGGTSTDVARYSGRLEHVYETTTAGVTIQAPQLDINTVAAGGGSRLFFRAGMFAVGPESAGAHPGPVCYRKGGPLAVTDANLLLGRIVPEEFPHIFGPKEDEPLDVEATRRAFQALAGDIAAYYASEGGKASSVGGDGGVHVEDSVGAGAGALASRPTSLDEIAAGFIAVANEAMCRPIRALTQMKGYDLTKHVLACFGGAGPQHACAMAHALGVPSIFISRYSGVLSAYGISLADVVQEAQEPVTVTLVQGGAVSSAAGWSASGSSDEALSACLADAAPFSLPTHVLKDLAHRAQVLLQTATGTLAERGFSRAQGSDVQVEVFVNLRFLGTDSGIMTPCSILEGEAGEGGAAFLPAQVIDEAGSSAVLELLQTAISSAPAHFVRAYKREFGFVLKGRDVVVDDVRVRATARDGAAHADLSDPANTVKGALQAAAAGVPPPISHRSTSVYFPGAGRVPTPIFMLASMSRGQTVRGPAMLLDKTSTIVVDPGFTALIVGRGDVYMTADRRAGAGGGDSVPVPPTTTTTSEASVQRTGAGVATTAQGHEAAGAGAVPALSKWRENPLLALPDPASLSAVPSDPVQLSIFGHRFMGIAEQMGRTLQRTAVSVNMRERLDYSCALFGPDGGLVANAPHIPVHLGAMQDAVRFQLAYWGRDIAEGDVFVSNHPQLAGGSHLPDITVISPVFARLKDGSSKIAFFVASRGHHADVGGIAPGSMPPTSTSLAEEGAAIIAYKLVRQGVFQDEGVTELLLAPGKSGIPGCAGSRNLRDCLSDLRAQVAANTRGITLVGELIAEYGLVIVHAYMAHIQAAAERAVRDMLKSFATGMRSGQVGGKVVARAVDHMDDGSPIALAITVDPMDGSSHFDFTGTGAQVLGNSNAPRAVTYSAIIYALRCLVGVDVPLNQGCLAPVTITIPQGSMLDPDPTAAVVGGNVLTSQRVVDVVFKAFRACAASQGCMNNLTFGSGGEDGGPAFGFYETICGGAGAGPSWHGRSGVHSHMTNTRITDPEIMERRYPVVLRGFTLREGSGGVGEWQGGQGVCRTLQFRRSGLKVSILSERRAFRPYGMAGGGPGAPGMNFLVKADGRRINIGSKATVAVQAGDVLVVETPGGGGYGAPTTSTSSSAREAQGTASADLPPELLYRASGSLSLMNETQNDF